MNLDMPLMPFGEPLNLNGKVCTAAYLICESLLVPQEIDDAQTKLSKFNLALKIERRKSNCRLTADEIAVIKTCTAKLNLPYQYYGGLCQVIDPNCIVEDRPVEAVEDTPVEAVAAE